MTQNNLGIAYSDLPTGDRGENLRKRHRLLRSRTTRADRTDFPPNWAMTQNNLGIAYRDFPTATGARTCVSAINGYDAALTRLHRSGLPLRTGR